MPDKLNEYLTCLHTSFSSRIRFPTRPHVEDHFNQRNIWDIASSIYEGRYTDAVKTLALLKHDDQRIVRQFYSQHVLFEKEREWVGHGINRTFRFWSEADKIDYLRFSMSVLDTLNHEYDAVLGYGSVLSIVRDGDLNPNDDDLDIIVALSADNIDSYNFELKRLDNYLQSAGFIVTGDYPAHRHARNEKFCVDVFLGLIEDEYVSWHPGPRKEIKTRDVFPAAVKSLYDIECKIPNNSEIYLAAIYGNNWRKPISGWTHNFNPAKYKDWFWPDKI